MQTRQDAHVEMIRKLSALRAAVDRALEEARARWEAELEPRPSRGEQRQRTEAVADRLPLA